MQDDLSASDPLLNIQILGVNSAGAAPGNASITAGRDLPWLQDVDGVNVWTSWNVTWRDVVILDADNAKLASFNLTANNLQDSANYNALRGLLIEAAAVPEPGTFMLIGLGLGLMTMTGARRAT